MPSQPSSQEYTQTAQVNPAEFAYRVSPNRWRSFRDAVAGFGYMFVWQKNIRILLIVSIGVIGLALWLHISRIEWAVLILTIALVWVAEFINAGIEAAIDLAIGNTYHPMAQVGKDVAAAAVLLASLFALLIGLLLFLEPLLNRVSAILGT